MDVEACAQESPFTRPEGLSLGETRGSAEDPKVRSVCRQVGDSIRALASCGEGQASPRPETGGGGENWEGGNINRHPKGAVRETGLWKGKGGGDTKRRKHP